jgi:hypothetical protein
LAGDQHGATAMAILDNLHQIAALAGREAIGSRLSSPVSGSLMGQARLNVLRCLNGK